MRRRSWAGLTESVVEEAALAWLGEMEWSVAYGRAIAPGEPEEERDDFSDYISVYDIQRAVEDRATVPIYYESRLAKLALDEVERPKIDPAFEEATKGEEVERKEKLKSKWAQLRVFDDESC